MMKTKLSGIMTLFLAFVVQFTFAQERTITGTVSDETGALPGVSVLIEGTTTGTETDFDGNYTIVAKGEDNLRFSFVGMTAVIRNVGSKSVVNITLVSADNTLDEVIVTALGMKKSAKSLPFASQPLKAEELQEARESNINNAIAGKVSGVQVRSQAGSKLGSAGDIRIRGAIGLSEHNPLYVVDGIPGISPGDINMDNVASINVLKGPNATALYGQRAAGGVIIIETIKGTGEQRSSISFTSSLEIDKVDITSKYQNVYGGGGDDTWRTYKWSPNHPEEWKVLEGKRYHDYTDDASWGPKYDGKDYIPWSAWYPGTKYSNKTAPFTAKPNNIQDYYDTAINSVNNVSFTKSGEAYSGRVSYTRRDVSGIIPGTTSANNFLSISFDAGLTDKFSISTSVNMTDRETVGDFDDDYSNNSAGSFNQWFHRDVDTKVLRELNKVSGNGLIPTWNLRRNPSETNSYESIALGNYWINPYSQYSEVKNVYNRNVIYGNVSLKYDITDHLSMKGTFFSERVNSKNENKTPKINEISAAQSGIKNSYYLRKVSTTENNYEFITNYNRKFGAFGVDVLVGGNIRDEHYDNISGSTKDGLQIPDFYKFSNSVTKTSPSSYKRNKQVRSLFTKANFDYDDFLFLEASYRKDYSSALPSDNNGYGYPSVGGSFVFSKFLGNSNFLTFGKLRAGWAQIGSDIDAFALTSSFGSGTPYDSSNPLLSISNTLVDPNIVVPLNESIEFGTDLKFFRNRLGISYTYFDETRKDEVQRVSISPASGFSSYLTNAGSFQRKGHELTVNATIIETKNFSWNTTINWSTVESTVIKVNDQVDEIATRGYWALFYFTQTEGKEYGQIKGTAFKRDENGNKIINANGSYQIEKNHYFGSVLPDWNGGWYNSFTYKNLSLSASIDFQKGGLFYSLSSQWGTFSGLYEETAAINDKGKNVRDAVADGGGVRVDGVDENGKDLTVYRAAHAHFNDFFFKRLTEQNLYDATYVKLREIALTYNLPKKYIKQMGLTNFSLSVFGKNLGLLYKDGDNPNIDPSIISRKYGEYGQQPGTITFGSTVKIAF